MKIFKLVIAGLFLVGCSHSGTKIHWGYEGDMGPNHWGQLSEEFIACEAGKNQSPINLRSTIESDLKALRFNYAKVPLRVVNNGHTVQVDYREGSDMIIGGHDFQLIQFHFHSPSENHVDGQEFPLEAHFVHSDDQGNLAVVAVMFVAGNPNSFIDTIWNSMSPDVGKQISAPNVEINAFDLLPGEKDYYLYNGSLTTPPCTEGVRWIVMKKTVEIAQNQVEKFNALMGNDNNRPIQPVFARPVLQ